VLVLTWVLLLEKIQDTLYRPEATFWWKVVSYAPGLGLAVLMALAFSALEKRVDRNG